MNFLEKYNRDEIFFRGLIIGLLSSLNNRITYYQTTDSGDEVEIFIPFFYSLAGDEPFLEDFYLNYGDCNGNPAFAEGNYDVVPRGIIEYSGSIINTSSSTNKYVRGTYEKEITQSTGGSEMKAYSSYLAPIPIISTFSIKIKVDTIADSLKIQARTIELLFQNFVYYFEYTGFRVPVQISLPASFPEKTPNQFIFSYGSTRGEGVTLSFSVSAETYLPQIDKSSERFRGNLMQGGIKLGTKFGIVSPTDPTILTGITNINTNNINTSPGSIVPDPIGFIVNTEKNSIQ